MTDPDHPLSSIMIDNQELISRVIDAIGPSAVAEFFVNAGTAIAALYDPDVVDEPTQGLGENEGVK